MDEVTLTAMNGSSLHLARRSPPDDGHVWSYEARLTLAGASGGVRTVVYDTGPSLAPFVRELADAWKGFGEARRFASLEGHLAIDARHDGRGTVWCSVWLGDPFPSGWGLRASLDFGAGAHLDGLAGEVAAFAAPAQR